MEPDSEVVAPSMEILLSSHITMSLKSFKCPASFHRFLADAFHQVAVGGEHIGEVIGDLGAEAGGHEPLAHGHAHGGGDAWPSGPVMVSMPVVMNSRGVPA